MLTPPTTTGMMFTTVDLRNIRKEPRALQAVPLTLAAGKREVQQPGNTRRLNMAQKAPANSTKMTSIYRAGTPRMETTLPKDGPAGVVPGLVLPPSLLPRPVGI